MLCIDYEMICKLVSDVILIAFTHREKVTGKWLLAPVIFSPILPYLGWVSTGLLEVLVR